MPTPGPIRKEILRALDNSILPALWQQKMPMGYVTPALQFPSGITSRHLSATVPRAQTENVAYPMQARWPSANMYATTHPCFGIIYDGVADLRTLVTAAQSAKSKTEKGIHAIRLFAPSFLFYPPGTIRDGGDADLWQDASTAQPPMKSIWVNIHSELLTHTHIRTPDGRRYISHSLQFNDPTITALADLLVRELPGTPHEGQQPVQALLLALMQCIQKNLHSGQVKIANTSRSPIALPHARIARESTAELCYDCAIFIQMHLHDPLTLTQIAKVAGVSPVHLNRLFHSHYGMTVMRYVREQRIAAAQKILKRGPENITEIAALVGFKRASAFCGVFRRTTGLTPNQYRRQHQQNKAVHRER